MLQINGGETVAAPAEAPWTVLINMQGAGSAGPCTGAIIDPGRVLTAAHCTYDEHFAHWPKYTVSAGVADVGQEAPGSDLQQRGVSSVQVHPAYVPGATAPTSPCWS